MAAARIKCRLQAPSAEQIIELRVKHGFSQTEFGALLGDSLRSVQMWESGERELNPVKWAYIAHGLGEKSIKLGGLKPRNKR